MEKNIIEIKNLKKNFEGKNALHDINFSVQKGTIHGFIGPNGAGKTTTLSCLTRLIIPNSGEIYIDGKSVQNNPNFNQKIGFIPAEPNLPELTVEDYILDCGYLRDISKIEVLEKLSNSPLSQFRFQNCNSLSTG